MGEATWLSLDRRSAPTIGGSYQTPPGRRSVAAMLANERSTQDEAGRLLALDTSKEVTKRDTPRVNESGTLLASGITRSEPGWALTVE